MWVQQVINEQEQELYASGSHVELSCYFKNPSGDTVFVTSPTVTFSPDTPGTILQPLALDNDIPSKYTIKFLTDGLAPGDYTVEFSGTWEGSPLTVNGSFQLYTINKIQYLIQLVRSLLHDKAPQLYIVRVPSQDTFKWRDGEIYDCLIQAMRYMNDTPPVGIKWASIDTVPFEGYLVGIAMMVALNQRQLLEIANVINYSDEVSFNLEKDQKYLSKAQFEMGLLWESWRKLKWSYGFSAIQHQGLISLRYPLQFLSQLSNLPNSRNTFGNF